MFDREYDYESNDEGTFDITESHSPDKKTTIVSGVVEEDVVINLVDHLNEPLGGYYGRECEESDTGEYNIFTHDDNWLIKVPDENAAVSLMVHLNREA
jgi:hypothetical protein